MDIWATAHLAHSLPLNQRSHKGHSVAGMNTWLGVLSMSSEKEHSVHLNCDSLCLRGWNCVRAGLDLPSLKWKDKKKWNKILFSFPFGAWTWRFYATDTWTPHKSNCGKQDVSAVTFAGLDLSVFSLKLSRLSLGSLMHKRKRTSWIQSVHGKVLWVSQSQTEISRQRCNSNLVEVSATLVTLQRAYFENSVFLRTSSEKM